MSNIKFIDGLPQYINDNYNYGSLDNFVGNYPISFIKNSSIVIQYLIASAITGTYASNILKNSTNILINSITGTYLTSMLKSIINILLTSISGTTDDNLLKSYYNLKEDSITSTPIINELLTYVNLIENSTTDTYAISNILASINLLSESLTETQTESIISSLYKLIIFGESTTDTSLELETSINLIVDSFDLSPTVVMLDSNSGNINSEIITNTSTTITLNQLLYLLGNATVSTNVDIEMLSEAIELVANSNQDTFTEAIFVGAKFYRPLVLNDEGGISELPVGASFKVGDITIVIPLAKLTVGGEDGYIKYNNSVITDFKLPT